MNYLIFDLETIADPAALPCLVPVKPDARLVDPVKIEASIKERTSERDAQLALHPHTNRIVALGFHVVGQDAPSCLLAASEDDERAHLQVFWDLYRTLDKRQDVRLVTFYGLSFDLPTLLFRSLCLDVPYVELDLDRYRSPHAAFDLWWRLSCRGAVKAHGLRFYAKRFGFGTLDKVDGAQVAQLVAEDRWDEIAAHCLSDIGLTHSLANRLKLLKLAPQAVA